MRCLVLYFSNGNNTRIVGKEIARQIKAYIEGIYPYGDKKVEENKKKELTLFD